MKKTAYAIMTSLVIVSCNEKAPRKENSEKVEITVQKTEKTEKPASEKSEKPSSEWNFMKADVENFPVLEETSFDTYEESYQKEHPEARVYTKLTKEQVEKLGLQNWLQNNSNVSINYELPYSKDFKTFVFSYQDGEMELKTAMVTFDKNFKKIDELQVAYDEIAESWLWSKSEIDKDKIVVTDYNEAGGELETTKTIYKLNKEGKFVKL